MLSVDGLQRICVACFHVVRIARYSETFSLFVCV